MRRWTLLAAGAALWLFLAAAPALADGGPHVADINSGVSSLTTDSCAGCHRTHTAQGPLLLNKASEEELCLQCHGTTSTGATTDVETGVQYVPAANGTRPTAAVQLGALRSGGFEQARIGDPFMKTYSGSRGVSKASKVQVASAPAPVTSAHMPGLAGLTQPGRAWGNGANGSGPGPAVSISCGSCHNPHGNDQYRILNKIPGDGSGPLVEDTTANPVTDAPNPTNATRNYTVIQTPRSLGYLLLAEDVVAGGFSPLAGDYFHRGVPWNTRENNDAPNGIADGLDGPVAFNDEITQWCSGCHTRHYSVDAATPTSDPIYRFRHVTVSSLACTTCHVSHGSNASMEAAFGSAASSTFTYPDGTASDSSRLLKIDRRGTCQACHDPTGTFPRNSSAGPVPVPLVP